MSPSRVNEAWKPIPGHPGYEASDRGQVRSVDRVVTVRRGLVGSCQKRLRGRVLQQLETWPRGQMPRRWVVLGGRKHAVGELVKLAFNEGNR